MGAIYHIGMNVWRHIGGNRLKFFDKSLLKGMIINVGVHFME
jgi:hypothetical protein